MKLPVDSGARYGTGRLIFPQQSEQTVSIDGTFILLVTGRHFDRCLPFLRRGKDRSVKNPFSSDMHREV
jgi:hypothetical protein